MRKKNDTRLSAATPELLEALIDLLGKSLSEVPNSVSGEYAGVWSAANAAIEKATGKETGFNPGRWEPDAIIGAGDQ